MDFSTITSVNSYLKTTKLKTQVKLRAESGDMTSHKKSLDEWISGQTNTAAEPSTSGDSQMQTIQAKLSGGKKLTAEEKAYLKEKDPVAYQKALSSEQEQKRYEQELKRCRTKEEVQRVRLSHLSSSLSAVNSIKNNPHISEEKKLQLMSIEQGKQAAMERITQKFVKERQYQNLPTDAERAEAEKQEKPQQSDSADQTEKTDSTKKTDRPKQSEETEKAPSAEPDTPAEQEAVRKTKRAKAMAAYAQTSGAELEVLVAAQTAEPSLDVQA